jgi:hypothetical protein
MIMNNYMFTQMQTSVQKWTVRPYTADLCKRVVADVATDKQHVFVPTLHNSSFEMTQKCALLQKSNKDPLWPPTV